MAGRECAECGDPIEGDHYLFEVLRSDKDWAAWPFGGTVCLKHKIPMPRGQAVRTWRIRMPKGNYYQLSSQEVADAFPFLVSNLRAMAKTVVETRM